MTPFPLGARVRNIRTGELGTIVHLPVPRIAAFALATEGIGVTYDGDEGTIWDTPRAKLELLIVEDGE